MRKRNNRDMKKDKLAKCERMRRKQREWRVTQRVLLNKGGSHNCLAICKFTDDNITLASVRSSLA